MIHPNGDDPRASAVVEESAVETPETGQVAPPAPGAPAPFATRNKMRPRQQFAQNKMVLIAGGAIAVVLLLFVFSSAPAHKKVALKGNQGAIGRQGSGEQSKASQGDENADEQKSWFPVIESGRTPAKDSHPGLIGEQDVEHTATRQPKNSRSFPDPRIPQGGTLGSIPPFDGNVAWQAPAYQPVSNTGLPNNETPKVEREQPSLFFVRKIAQANSSSTAEPTVFSPAFSLEGFLWERACGRVSNRLQAPH